MMNRKRAIALGVVLLGMASWVNAAPKQDMETRVERLERLMDSQSLVDMLTTMEQLQREVQQLRGQVEEQSHLIEGLKRRQRELYLDVDRRLSRMERESAPAVVPTGNPDNNVTREKTEAKPSDAESLADERAAYQQGFDLLRKLRYKQAVNQFQQFLKRYPDSRYAHIAQYWMGEANYAQRNFKQAIADYQGLLDKYPNSPKLAEALLKIGYSYNELGDQAAATEVLNRLTRQYPDTTEAGQARNLLQKLRRGG